ncbi:hypothetical protein DFQ28_004322, partial [Apophysomyces sp. BC1034]
REVDRFLNIGDYNRNAPYDYWKTTPVAAWDVTAHGMSLLKQSYNSKHMAHGKLQSDLILIKDTFPKQHEIKFGTFWSTTVIQMNRSVQDLEVASLKLKKSSMNAAYRTLDDMSSQDLLDDPRPIAGPSITTTQNAAGSEHHLNKKQKVTSERSREHSFPQESTPTAEKSADFDLIKAAQ